MYTFEVAPVTVGIEDVLNEYGIIQADGMITVKNTKTSSRLNLFRLMDNELLMFCCRWFYFFEYRRTSLWYPF